MRDIKIVKIIGINKNTLAFGQDIFSDYENGIRISG
jgi:hypothetical protein